MFPYIKSAPTYTLNIPEMSGGMNLRDGLSLVADNQLTDCKNVWFKDALLKTRPKMGIFQAAPVFTSGALTDGDASVKVYCDPQYVIRYKNHEYHFAVTVTHGKFIKDTFVDSKLSFMFFTSTASDGVKQIIKIGAEPEVITDGYVDNVLIIESDGFFYALVSGIKRTVVEGETKETRERFGMYRCSIDPKRVEIMGDWQMYVPTVYSNCTPTNDESIPTNGTTISSYNLLSNQYKMGCTLPERIEKPLDTYYYSLPYAVSYTNKDGGYTPYLFTGFQNNTPTVTAEITYSDGMKVKHEVNLDTAEAKGFVESAPKDDGYKMCVRNKTVCFLNSKNEEVCPTDSISVRDNMIITAPKMVDEDAVMKVYGMTKSIWFGGNVNGLYGGTRLFLGGNVVKNDQALMVWSDLDNPLFFPVGNRVYVGDKSKALTAFGRQDTSLVILKYRELYQAEYVSSNISADENIEDGGYYDLTQSAYFPLRQVHGYIGCDCPNTVQLCRNRLVWANSDGKVYTLITQNQYNERAVFSVSEMIDPKLRKESLAEAFSADWNGYYCLLVGKRMYVMDYNSYGFSYISSFSKSEDANIKIPWYYWELPDTAHGLILNEGRLVIPIMHEWKQGNDDNKTYHRVVMMAYIDGTSGDDDVFKSGKYTDDYEFTFNTQKIHSTIQTKLYDFNHPARLKSVPIVNFSFGYNDTAPIKVEFVSERKISDEHEIIVEGIDEDARDLGYLHQFRLFPYTKSTVMFGAKISCDGELAIASMSLQYKALGGAK